ncbi:MAG: PAS domain S-box protein [Thermoanaerobaculales bacterium]
MAQRRPPSLSAVLLGLVLAVLAVTVGSFCLRQDRLWRWEILRAGERGLSSTAIRSPLPVGGAGPTTLAVFAGVAGSVWFRRRRSASAGPVDAERYWRALADHNPMPVLSVQGVKVVGANLAAAEALGADRLSLLGRDVLDLIAPEDAAAFSHFLSDATHGGKTGASFPGKVSGAADRELPVEFRVESVEEDGGRLCYVAWQPATAPEDSETWLRAIAAAVPHPLVFCDPDGNVVWSNDAACERTGYSPSRLRSRPLLPAIDPVDRRGIRVALGRARRGRPFRGHVRMRSESGELLEGRFRSVPVHSTGSLLGVLFVAMELTAEGDAGEFGDLRRDRVLSHLGTSLAHRLRNDLQALLGLLDKRTPSGASDQALAAIRRLVTSAVEDLRRFVAISRSGAASPREISLGEVVGPWFARVRQTLPEGLRITLRRDAIEDRTVLDATQLTLALDVALAAATRAMGESGGAVEVAIEEGKLPSTLRVTLSDTGMVSEEQAAAAGAGRLLFTREAALAVADLVAQRHRGRAGARVRTGIGGKWWIELPRTPARKGEPEALSATAGRGAILVADDEEMVRSSLAAALREAGAETVEASNGREAVDLVLASPGRFALVVLDLVMPVMDGREALHHLRIAAPGLPVIVCTGYDPAGDGELASAALLIKPFSIDEFLAKVRDVLTRPPESAHQGDSITQ